MADLQAPAIGTFDPGIRDALRRIADPCSIATGVPIDLVDMGLVISARREGTAAQIVLQLTSTICMQIGLIEAKIREEVGRVPGIASVEVEIDHAAEWLPSMIADEARTELRRRRPFATDPAARGPVPVRIGARDAG